MHNNIRLPIKLSRVGYAHSNLIWVSKTSTWTKSNRVGNRKLNKNKLEIDGAISTLGNVLDSVNDQVITK